MCNIYQTKRDTQKYALCQSSLTRRKVSFLGHSVRKGTFRSGPGLFFPSALLIASRSYERWYRLQFITSCSQTKAVAEGWCRCAHATYNRAFCPVLIRCHATITVEVLFRQRCKRGRGMRGGACANLTMWCHCSQIGNCLNNNCNSSPFWKRLPRTIEKPVAEDLFFVYSKFHEITVINHSID